MSKKPVSSRQAATQEDLHFRIMRLVEANPDMSQRDLAVHVDISLGSLNYCLKALIEKGFIKLDNFQNSKHKFKYAYILTPAGIALKVALTARFLKRKIQEYDALKAEIESLENELSAGQGIDRKLQKAPSEPGFKRFPLSSAAVRVRGCGP
jgi:EPS-associated MarR family transcriptional regulator